MKWIKRIILTIFMFVLLLINSVSYIPEVEQSKFRRYANTQTTDITEFYYNTNKILNLEYINPSLNGQYYSMTPGAAVYKNDINKLVFEIAIDDLTINNDTSTKTYLFTLGQVSNSLDSVEQVAVLSLTIDSSGNGAMFLARKNENYNENLYLENYTDLSKINKNSNDAEKKNSQLYSGFDITMTKLDYSVGFYNESTCINTHENKVRVVLEPSDFSKNYVLHFEHLKFGNHFSSMEFVDETYSSVVSQYDVLNQMRSISSFEDELDPEQVDKAYSLVGETIKQNVIVEYLVRLGDTPFAVKKQKKVNVPIIDGKISPEHVAEALSVPTMGVMQSYCEDFVYDAEKGIYITRYAKSIWLNAKTTDGNNMNYFLDCNLSYYDYYYQFVEDGIFSYDLYDYIFNKIKLDYPEVSKYKPSEIYSYFGMVSIPTTYSINTLWEEMFNTETTFDGILYKYKFTETLSLQSYNKLLQDYGYKWLEIVWNDIAPGLISSGEYTADTYLFYADVETNEAFIGENGAEDIEDNDSLIDNEVDEIVDNLFSSDFMKEFETIIGILLVVVLLSTCTPIFKEIFKFLFEVLSFLLESVLYVIVLPFKLIISVFKK